ncbi:MAG: hypothetical protein V4594_01310 [Bacteroidota bacterium]
MYNNLEYSEADRRLLKKAVWLYFLLLIFEGALRKWFLPFLSAPLLIIRDPIAMWVIYKMWSQNILPVSRLMYGMVALGLAGILTAILFGHGNPFVAFFGARVMIVQFPFLFIIGYILNREDVVAMGRVLAWVSIPMTGLIILQFYSPQSSFLNRGAGGVEGLGIGGALGYFRPSGTFSFTTGTQEFYSLLSCFLFYFWFTPNQINRFVLALSTIALLVAIPFSISRSLAFQVAINMIVALFAIARNPEYFFRIVFGSVVLAIVSVILLNVDVLQHSINAFASRFKAASTIEGGLEGTITNRYFGKMLTAFKTALDQPFFGYGIGLGTNAGSALLTGARKFLVAEEEWNRQIGELGAFMGISVIAIRLALSFKMCVYAYFELRRDNLLPWMFLGLILTSIPKAQWAQPTTLGFSILMGGLLIAALKVPDKEV